MKPHRKRAEDRNEGITKQPETKKMEISTNLGTITFNVDGVGPLIKRQRG